jgi:hypothetical protein
LTVAVQGGIVARNANSCPWEKVMNATPVKFTIAFALILFFHSGESLAWFSGTSGANPTSPAGYRTV